MTAEDCTAERPDHGEATHIADDPPGISANRLAAGDFNHPRREVGARHGEAELGEGERDPAGATGNVQNGRLLARGLGRPAIELDLAGPAHLARVVEARVEAVGFVCVVHVAMMLADHEFKT
jgi:hypothetical protein